MYRWIWGKLPGNKLMKLVQASLLIGLLVAVLFIVVFPWLDLLFIAPPTIG